MIYITGDTHGEFYPRLREKALPNTEGDYLIICGDFGGLWNGSKYEVERLDWLAKRPFTTLFISGNHENFDMLKEFPIAEWNGGKVQFIRDNIIHLLRGQIFELEGHTFFTMGGASSHDISDGILQPNDPDLDEKIKLFERESPFYRINHVSWWKEELPSYEEYAEANKNLAAHNHEVDYIITHCAPTSIAGTITNETYPSDRLTNYLETLYKTCKFKKWYFGHYHKNLEIDEKMMLIYKNIVRFDTRQEAIKYLYNIL